MKKSLIAIMLILTALFFISCEKDKSEEVVTTYEKFCETYLLMDPVTNLFPKESKTLYNEPISSDHMKAFLAALYPEKGIEVKNDSSLVFEGGEIKFDGSDTDKIKKAKTNESGAVFIVSYKLSDKEIENEKYTIILTSSIEENENKLSASFYLKINDKDYGTIKYEYNGEKFTSASYNGKSVDVRLLNATHISPSPANSDSESGTETKSE